MSDHHPIEDFASGPGETLLDSINALGVSSVELAQRSGLDETIVRQIISGEEPITYKTALALEKVLHVPAHFWLNLESNYREHLTGPSDQL